MQVKASQAISMMSKCLRARKVPMMEGSPGSGKSQIVYQMAKDYNLKVIDLRLSQCDPTDLLGFPNISKHLRAGYCPMETFPIEGDAIPEGYSGWLLFLDELTSAPGAVQAAAYKLILDRMVGQHRLHKNVAIVGAGNKITDNAIVEEMSTALQSRMVWMELVVDAQEWNKWAAQHNIDHRITSYINWKPASIYTFQPDHTDKTYACPRTWEFANDLLAVAPVEDPDCFPLLAGTISEGVAREFMGFCKIHNDLPKIETLISSPSAVPVPEEPSILYAISGAISQHATKENMGNLMKFVERMPLEFQVVCLRESVHRNRALAAHPAVHAWRDTAAIEYF